MVVSLSNDDIIWFGWDMGLPLYFFCWFFLVLPACAGNACIPPRRDALPQNVSRTQAGYFALPAPCCGFGICAQRSPLRGAPTCCMP